MPLRHEKTSIASADRQDEIVITGSSSTSIQADDAHLVAEIDAMLGDLPMTSEPVEDNPEAISSAHHTVPRPTAASMAEEWRANRERQRDRERERDRRIEERRDRRRRPGKIEETPEQQDAYERARKAKNKADQRARERALKSPAPVKAPAAPLHADPAELPADQVALDRWLSRGGPIQRQIARDRDLIIDIRGVLLRLRADLGRDPSRAEFSEMLSVVLERHFSLDEARRRLDKQRDLEAPGGPWSR